jgi:hypothetical protein
MKIPLKHMSYLRLDYLFIYFVHFVEYQYTNTSNI